MSIVKLNNQGVKNATAFGSITGLGSMIFIKKLTASSSATLSFVDGSNGVVLDDTYKEYVFTFKNIHPSADNNFFAFNMSTDGGSNYNVSKTSTTFDAYHQENGSDAGLRYNGDNDLANGTGVQKLNYNMGGENDASLNGTLTIFNPSSSVFVKHFMSSVNFQYLNTYSIQNHIAGYGNTQSPIDAIQFSMGSGNIDAGDICLYGIA